VVFSNLFPRGYERTCQSCGYVWRLSRNQAKFRPRRPTAIRPRLGTVPMSAVHASESSFAEQLQLSDQFRHCAACGSRNFSQRPLPDYRPPE
jgi:hypothetical protein